MTEHGEKLGQALRFVDHDPFRVAVEESLDVSADLTQVGRALHVEVEPIGIGGPYQRALPALAWTHDEHDRKFAEEPAEAGLRLSADDYTL